VVRGLREDDARALLDSVVPGRLDERVRDRIIAETRGNPLALLELPRGLTVAELAGGFDRPDARPLASQIEQSFLRRIRSLSGATQRLLLVAAAEPVGDAPRRSMAPDQPRRLGREPEDRRSRGRSSSRLDDLSRSAAPPLDDHVPVRARARAGCREPSDFEEAGAHHS
jgi:hypothetical protein